MGMRKVPGGVEFSGPMTTEEMREFVRRMDWLMVAHRLAEVEGIANASLLSNDADLQKQAKEVLELVRRVRSQHQNGTSYTSTFGQIERAIRRWDENAMAPYAETGLKVREGGARGAEVAYGAEADRRSRQEELARAVREEMALGFSYRQGCEAVGGAMGVSWRTIDRACKACGVNPKWKP